MSAPLREGADLDLFSLNIAERQRMYLGWKEEIMDPIQRSLLANLKAYEDVKVGLDRIRAEVDLRVLSSANVIGVTTSGLARNLGLLRRLNSKVLLVEEAGGRCGPAAELRFSDWEPLWLEWELAMRRRG